jgi:hypothetical protein
MDDVGRSSMKSAAAAVAPVAAPLLSRCSVPLPFGSSAVPSTAG